MTRTATITTSFVYRKAQRILADPARVITSEHAEAPDWWTGRVVGDHNTYSAFAVSEDFQRSLGMDASLGRVGCFCPRGRQGKLCSHMIVAEEMRRRGEDT